MAVVTTNLGTVTAYGDAVAAGYTGTKEQWQALMADYATVGQQAAQDAQTASTAATTATTAAQTATTKAGEASASAEAAAESAAAIGTPDTTLTQSGKAADAKAVGDEISELKEDLQDISEAANGVINMTVSAQTLPQGANATVTKTEDEDGIINLDFGLPLASGEVQVVNVSGSNPTITAEYNKRYVCGEVSTLTITPASQGCTDVLFTSGTTPTVLSLPSTVKMPSWFSVEASKTYEINILDGVYGSVMSWT